MSIRQRSAAAVLALAVAGCTGNPPTAVPPSPSGATSPESSPTIAGIGHPTGPSDVVLRFEEGGGFVMPFVLVTQTPIFTLYGDGTIIFRRTTEEPLPPEGSIARQRPLRTAHLSEPQVQDLLDAALNQAGLAVARERYDHAGVADAPTATFTVNVEGLRKTVVVYALGIEAVEGPDGLPRAAFNRLAERLRDFDSGGAFASQPYGPSRYRAVLMDPMGVADAPVAWPWPAIKPTDFVASGDDAIPNFPRRVLAPDEAAALGVGQIDGGVQGLTLRAPDGKLFAFALRPLLPDEAS